MAAKLRRRDDPPVLQRLEAHLATQQVSRIVYGTIVGLALIVALAGHPPRAGQVIALLVGTATAVALAEVYSEVLGAETRGRRHLEPAELREVVLDVAAVW